ncbi:glycosyltransferase family 2 protein [Nakamurella leprariae]|uniref:Glycosyltransferase n=1 Tax=Nakamurella leprariae TaxID=2803911 RepID=A0A939BZH4_9ACTN|nr:glycosyltransferase [Nakamurella leprariae]MBM9467711.1 glycosyltransferase [Nakamurella leprariae]
MTAASATGERAADIDLGAPHLDAAPARPLVSVLVPVYRTGLDHLGELIRSVRAQRDPDWELLLVDDCSHRPELTALLRRAADRDSRIRIDALPENRGIVGASNHALSMARGEFVALLDHDDLLEPDAVRHCREAVERTPDADVLYTDEAIIDPDGVRQGVFAKPVFSPERLRRQNFTLHLSVYRRRLLEEIGGFRAGFDGSQDYDLVLRASEVARAVVAIPYSLYRWRILPTSVSHAAGNQYVFDSAVRAVQEHLDRTDVPARVVQVDVTGRYRIDREIPTGTTVSVVVLADGRATPYGVEVAPVVELVAALVTEVGARLADATVLLGLPGRPGAVAVPPEAVEAALRRRVRRWPAFGRVLPVADLDRAAGPLNDVLTSAAGTTVLLATDAVVPPGAADAGWLAPMLGLVTDRGIGAVGPRLVDDLGRVCAAGLTVSGGEVRRIGRGSSVEDPGPFGGLLLTREVTALPMELLLLDRAGVLRAGGLWPGAPTSGSLLDLAVKLDSVGLAAVVCAESVITSSIPPDQRRELSAPVATTDLGDRWGAVFAADRFWRDR